MQHPVQTTTLQVERFLHGLTEKRTRTPDPLVLPKAQKWTLQAERHFVDHPEDREKFGRMALDFGYFLSYCFVKPEGQEPICLGDVQWEAQEHFIRDTRLYRWIFFLKARQLGQSTIECAYDLWRTRFGGPNSRTHIISRSDTEAKSLLADVKYIHEKLPFWAQLPIKRDVDVEIVFGDEKDTDDERTIHAYTTNSPGRGETATHVHLDEWSDHPSPIKTWLAVEPSVAPGGTFHIVTTGQGPQNYASIYYRNCQAGRAKHVPIFYHALMRADRSEEWLAQTRSTIGDDSLASQEYPLTWEEAISGGGELRFASRIIDAASRYALGETGYRSFRRRGNENVPTRYIGAYDAGRHKDAAVIIILDVTFPTWQVVLYKRMRETPYPQQAIEIQKAAADFPTCTFIIEKNGPGEPVLEFLHLPQNRIVGMTMSRPAKVQGLAAIQLKLEAQELKWKGVPQGPGDDPVHAQLDVEVRGYQVPDDAVVQDSVMALLMAVEGALNPALVGRQGRLMGIISG